MNAMKRIMFIVSSFSIDIVAPIIQKFLPGQDLSEDAISNLSEDLKEKLAEALEKDTTG